jgi:hypothetical protein
MDKNVPGQYFLDLAPDRYVKNTLIADYSVDELSFHVISGGENY